MKQKKRVRAAGGGRVSTFDHERLRAADGGKLDISALIERALGGSYDELKRAGAARYPATPAGSQHHQEAARRAASAYGFIPSQILGLGVEGVEGLSNPSNVFTPDTLNDLIANFKGGLEGAIGTENYNKLRGILNRGDRVGATKSPGRAATIRGAKGGKVRKVMHEFKTGKLHSGSKKGPRVQSREQAIAIALSEARAAGESVPKRRRRGAKGGEVCAACGGRLHAAAGGRTVPTVTRLDASGNPVSGVANGAGGLVGQQQQYINALNADTGGIKNIVGTLKGFQPGAGEQIAQLNAFQPGGAEQVGQLSNFQPLQGLGAQTQNELLSTGFQTDVAPLTQAAQIQAGQTFADLQDKLNERYAALGLGSSSARETAVARQRANLAGQVAATGLQAGVGAAESAAARRAGGIGNELTASGQRLGALGTAGQLALGGSGQRLEAAGTAGNLSLGQSGQRLGALGTALGGEESAAGLKLNAQTAKAGAGQALLGSQMPQFGAEMAQAPAGVRPTGGGGSLLPAPQRSWLGGGAGATGGRADLGDFLSNLIYGRTFTRRSPEPSYTPRQQAVPAPSTRDRFSSALPRRQQVELAPSGAPRSNADLVRYLNQGGTGVVPIGMQDPAALSSWLAWMGPQRVHEGLMQTGRILGSSAGTRGTTADTRSNQDQIALDRALQLAYAGAPRIQQGAGGGVPQPELPGELGISYPALVDPRRQFYAGGGEVPGQDTGHDKIPALLRSEELVVTPELARAIDMADPHAPQPHLIMQLQHLGQKPLDYSPMDGQHVAADGGRPGLLEWLRSLLPQGGGPSPEDLKTEARRQFQEGLPYNPPVGHYPIRPEDVPPIPPSMLTYQAPTGFETPPGEMPAIPEAGLPVGGPEALPPPPRGSVSISAGRLQQPGNAGFGTITPRAGRGSFSAMETTVPSAQPVGPDERRYIALDAAQRRRDLLQANLATDPVGSPDKQARTLTALQAADHQVNSLIAEIDAAEKRKIAEAQTMVAGMQAQANLNSAVADQLRAAAQKQTADAATAKVLNEAAANDPTVAALLNTFDQTGLGKTERGAEMAEAILKQILASKGVTLQENGWFRRLFGAPRFELAPSPGQETPAANAAPAALSTLQPEARAALAQFLGAGQ